MLWSTFWWWVLHEIVCLCFGSQITMSASAPTLTAPFRGYRLNIFAAWVETASTNWFYESSPAFTPLVHTTDSLSSNPFTPFGILLNWSFPILFCSVQKVQLSVPTTSITPLWINFMIWVLVVGSGLRQGDITYLDATSQSLSHSLVPSVPRVDASV